MGRDGCVGLSPATGTKDPSEPLSPLDRDGARIRSTNQWTAQSFPFEALFWVTCEDFFSAEPVERDDLIGLDGTPRNLHSRGANGHSGHGNAYDIRPFGHQTLYFGDRHMSLDNVAIHDGGVARLEFWRHLVADFHSRKILYVLGFYPEPAFLQIITPRATAASGRRFEHGDLYRHSRLAGRLAVSRTERQSRERYEYKHKIHEFAPFRFHCNKDLLNARGGRSPGVYLMYVRPGSRRRTRRLEAERLTPLET